MSNRVQVYDDGRVDLGALDPDEFGREIRRLSLDAHRVLSRPDGSLDELIHLHWRAWSLLNGAPKEQSDGIYGWLLAVRRAIVDRLHRWAAEELESSVA